MNIKEFYEYIGGDYQDAINRFLNENLVKKFALKFLADKSYLQLKNALQENDMETSFRAAHTLKGVCANLSFLVLYKLSSELTEQLRNPESEIDVDLVNKIHQEYERLISCLNEVQ